MQGASERVVVVTGASRGLGREIAVAFGTAGDRVLVNYRSHHEAATEVVEQIRVRKGHAFAFRADVSKGNDVRALIEAAVDSWGRIDVLVNNAGRTSDQILLRMTEEEWDSVMDTNLKGPFLAVRHAAAVMARQNEGHIINIASIVGIQGREGQANYSSAKAGLLGLTKAAARELGCHNIRVNAVLPGYLETTMGRSVPVKMLERIREQSVLNRFSEPREVAGFVLHLSRMKHVSGQVFNLDSRIV